jgi:hypothetical protein
MRSSRPSYATKSGRLTPEERDLIAKLSASRRTCGQIAMRLQRHPSTIYCYMVTHDLRAVGDRGGRAPYLRKGQPVSFFTPSEDHLILSLHNERLPRHEIASVITERFGHRTSARVIGTRLRMLATRAALGSEQSACR